MSKSIILSDIEGKISGILLAVSYSFVKKYSDDNLTEKQVQKRDEVYKFK